MAPRIANWLHRRWPLNRRRRKPEAKAALMSSFGRMAPGEPDQLALLHSNLTLARKRLGNDPHTFGELCSALGFNPKTDSVRITELRIQLTEFMRSARMLWRETSMRKGADETLEAVASVYRQRLGNDALTLLTIAEDAERRRGGQPSWTKEGWV